MVVKNMVDKTSLRDLNYQKEECELSMEGIDKLIKLSAKYDNMKDEEDYVNVKQHYRKILKRVNEEIKELEIEEEKESEGKIKTLNEIIEDIEPLGHVVNPVVLKIEAIKWLKEDKKTENIQSLDIGTLNFILDRWMKRFNISEKDILEW